MGFDHSFPVFCIYADVKKVVEPTIEHEPPFLTVGFIEMFITFRNMFIYQIATNC